MCGICGVLDPSGAPLDPRDLAAMMTALVHRGPDASGRIDAPGVAAGIRRLRVIDPEGGDQPIANEDGTIAVVFNGEIYNHAALRERLRARGHRFSCRADTEVLVHLWEDEGPDLVHALDGMFAFCLVDRRRREVFVARDALGIKPLFVRTIGSRLVFSSEVASLLRYPAPRPAVDPARLIDLFALQYVPGERTVFQEIRKLLPGHALHLRDGRITEQCWASTAPVAPAAGTPNEAEAAERLRTLLEEAVAAQAVADVPVGVFLSGGLDSTGIAALLARATPGRVASFSVGFDGEEGETDRTFAALASRALGTDHHELTVSADDLAGLLPSVIDHLDEPVLDPAILPTWLLARFARERVTVALSGEGADELFGGYRRHLYQERLGWMRAVPGLGPAARAGSALGVLPHRVGQALEAVALADPAQNHIQWSQTVSGAVLRELFDDGAVSRFEAEAQETFAPYFAGRGGTLNARLAADLGEWLPHDLLAKVDRASMAFSLEARVPYLANDVVRFASALPDELKIRGRVTKRLLRRALAGLVPKEIVMRRKKGFDLPLDAWIRGPLAGLTDAGLDDAHLRRWPGLDRKAARRLLAKHRAGSQSLGLPLFNLVSIGLFLERHGG
ncbi:MAG TPA: asparagine synthase (glutamine-hydrolyzing) [Candidatus Polarisedimenticolaceae bacterium]|nr:asparagine synthase (glutamine-hydrolyzing) [Candidatus Polarisedimenticolaceae bacterium]